MQKKSAAVKISKSFAAAAAAADDERPFRFCSSRRRGLGEAEAKLQWRRERLRAGSRPVPHLLLSTPTEGKVKLSKPVFQQSKAFLWHFFSKLVQFCVWHC